MTASFSAIGPPTRTQSRGVIERAENRLKTRSARFPGIAFLLDDKPGPDPVPEPLPLPHSALSLPHSPSKGKGRTSLETNAKARMRYTDRMIERHACADPRLREELEDDPEAWLLHMYPGAFSLPFGPPHREIIGNAIDAAKAGRWYAIAAPRGTGKTTVLNGLVMYLLATGACKFPAIIPWRTADASRSLRFWLATLVHNPRFASLYPELADPFVAGRGVPAKVVTLMWRDTEEITGAAVSLSNGSIILPDARGVVGASSINGNPRGLQFTAMNDEQAVWRPDLLLIDDPCNKKTAHSPTLIQSVIAKIDEDCIGMSGPDNTIPVLLTGTVISEGDPLSHYLSDETPDWKASRIRQIESMPSHMELWHEWNTLRLSKDTREAGEKAARAFYRKHKKAMKEGFKVSWVHRYDKKRGQPDAYYAAMYDYFRMGEKAFRQERQNEPEERISSLYELPMELVSRKTNGLARGEVPEVPYVTVGIDINIDHLSWSVCAIDRTLAAAVVDYGIEPEAPALLWTKDSPISPETAVARALRKLCLDLTTRWPQITRLAIDGNWMTDTVTGITAELNKALSCDVVTARGVSSRAYYVPNSRKRLEKRGEHCHILKQKGKGRALWFNSHQMHRILQTGFFLPTGSAGSVSLFGGPKNSHPELAEHICADRLVKVTQGSRGQEVHTWELDERYRNDLSDAIVMALAGAAVDGASPNAEKEHDEEKAAAKKKHGAESGARIRIGTSGGRGNRGRTGV